MNNLFNNDNDQFNNLQDTDYYKNNGSDYTSEIKVSPERKRTFKRLFITLIALGLILGGVFAFAVVKLLNHFGLTDKPSQPQIELKDQQLKVNPLPN
jgi:hypothetical protein